MRDRLLLIGIAGLTSGMLCCSFLFSGWALVLGAMILAALCALAHVLHRAPLYVYVSVFILLCTVGMVRGMFSVDEIPGSEQALLSTPRVLKGMVSTDPDIRESNQRVVIDVPYQEGHLRVLAVAPLYPELTYGDVVSLEGARTLPENFDGDGGRIFDYRHFLAKDRIYMMVSHAKVTVVGVDTHLSVQLMRFLYDGKHNFLVGLSRALPEPSSALASGILAGGKQGLGKILLEAFTVSGLLPIVVLSGYNVMIVAEAVMRALGWAPKRVAAISAALVIFGFILAAGLSASALRAGLMAGLALFARATNRTYDALRALLAVFVVLILINPLLLSYDPGFQFSFAAAMGLMLFSNPIAARLGFMRSGMLRDIIASTISAQLMVLPLLLYQTGNLSLVSLPANVLALPVIPLAMLLSFVAGMVGMVLPSIAPFIGFPAHVVLMYVIEVARVTSSLPFAHVILPAFSFLAVIASYGALLTFYAYMKRTTPQQHTAG